MEGEGLQMNFNDLLSIIASSLFFAIQLRGTKKDMLRTTLVMLEEIGVFYYL